VAANPLVGRWRLVSLETVRADGTIGYPLGPDAAGSLVYTDDGYMSVAIMKADREPILSGDLLGGTGDEKARAAEGYVSYCGRYEYHGDFVVHHVELSLFPNWIGGTQERRVDLSGSRLTLHAPPIVMGGGEQVARVVWERA